MIVALLASVLVIACSPPDTDKMMLEAKQYQQKGDLKAAVIVLNNVLQLKPEEGEARLIMGTISMQNRDPRAAEHHFRAALEAKVDPKVLLPLLAQALFEQAEFQKLLDATRASDYGDAAQQPEILSFRGHSQLSLGRLEEAAASFQEALKRRPEYAPALLGEARLALLKRDVPATVTLVDRALAADPSNIDAWLIKGDLDRAAGNFRAALADYEKGLALSPKSLAANLNLASLHMQQGELELARKHVRSVLETAPDSPIGYYLLGLLEFQSKNFAAANDAIQQVLKAAPSYLPATALAGVVAYTVGANEQAEQRLGDAVARYPTSVSLRKLFAAALLRSGKARRAIDVLEPALKAAPSDTGLLVLFAEAKSLNGEAPVARKYFELAAKYYPQSPGVRAGLGMTRLATGEIDKALADLEAAVELGSGVAEISLVKALVSMKRYDKALEAVARLEKKRPEDPVTFNLKGAVLFAKGDTAGARKAFEQAVALQPSKFAAARNLAQLDVRENNPAAARIRFEKILERDAENVPAMLALAELTAAAGNSAEALSWVKRARDAQPKSYAPSMALAHLYFAAGDYASAIAAVRDAVAADPDSADALNLLAYSQLRLGQRTQALATYSVLVSRYPKSAEAHYGLSGALSADGQYRAAERSLKTALQLRPGFPEAMYALAALQLRMGKTAEAGKLVGDAQKWLPQTSLASVIAGDTAMAEKRYDRAVQAYGVAFAAEKSREMLLRLHGALLGAGKTAAAEALTTEWLKKNPDDVQVRYLVADTAIRNQNFRLAAEQYEYVLKIEGTKLPLLHNLGMVYERMNDPRALELAETAYKIAPEQPGVLFNLGRLVLQKGDAERAVKLLEKARTMSPDSQLVRYDLAKAYIKVGSNDLARIELQQLLRSRQEFPERAEAEDLLRKLKN